jgi:hypothetical protein
MLRGRSKGSRQERITGVRCPRSASEKFGARPRCGGASALTARSDAPTAWCGEGASRLSSRLGSKRGSGGLHRVKKRESFQCAQVAMAPVRQSGRVAKRQFNACARPLWSRHHARLQRRANQPQFASTEGFSRAMYPLLSHCSRETAPAPARAKAGGRPSFPGPAIGEPAGKTVVDQARWYSALSLYPQIIRTRFFVFRPRFLEA